MSAPIPESNGIEVQEPGLGRIADGKKGAQCTHGEDGSKRSRLFSPDPIREESGELAQKQGDPEEREDGNAEEAAVTGIFRKPYLVSQNQIVPNPPV